MTSELYSAIEKFGLKLNSLDINSLEISDYNKGYLRKYQQNFDFYKNYYFQLLSSVFEVKKPVADTVFADYGGGCGILSFIACETGINTVIYNDIFRQSVEDVKIVAAQLGYRPAHFIHGDVNDFVENVQKMNLQVDYLCSFDVLEHIYQLDEWFKEIQYLPGNWQLCFMTSANGANAWKRRQLKKIHRQSEFSGFAKTKGWKEMDSPIPYLDLRRNIIKNKFPELKPDETDFLATATRGLAKKDIDEVILYYIKNKTITYKPAHPTNTCDPLTGNWNEHIIDLKKLQNTLRSLNFNSRLVNTTYAYSDNKLFNLPKTILNKVIKMLPDNNLYLSPMYILMVNKLG